MTSPAVAADRAAKDVAFHRGGVSMATRAAAFGVGWLLVGFTTGDIATGVAFVVWGVVHAVWEIVLQRRAERRLHEAGSRW